MIKKLLLVCIHVCVCQLQGSVMQEFLSLHVPMREDGKIYISPEIKHVKLDIGLSYSAPMSQYWLLHESDLMIFGFEPNLESVDSIKQGAVKREAIHGDPIDLQYVGKKFFVIPCALGLQSGKLVDFYITANSCGCCSLYRPKYFGILDIVQVPVFRLSDFFDLFPFDTHPVIDYIKIDAQGADLDIAKSAGQYLRERVVFITIEAENHEYENTVNSDTAIDLYMYRMGFRKHFSPNTEDPTYVNTKFKDYIEENHVQIHQKS